MLHGHHYRNAYVTRDIDAALGWMGNLRHERVQPVTGVVHVHGARLGPDATPRLHDTAAVVGDRDAFRAEIARGDVPVVREGNGGPGLGYACLDRRPLVAHSVDHVGADADRWRVAGARAAAEAR